MTRGITLAVGLLFASSATAQQPRTEIDYSVYSAVLSTVVTYCRVKYGSSGKRHEECFHKAKVAMPPDEIERHIETIKAVCKDRSALDTCLVPQIGTFTRELLGVLSNKGI